MRNLIVAIKTMEFLQILLKFCNMLLLTPNYNYKYQEVVRLSLRKYCSILLCILALVLCFFSHYANPMNVQRLQRYETSKFYLRVGASSLLTIQIIISILGPIIHFHTWDLMLKSLNWLDKKLKIQRHSNRIDISKRILILVALNLLILSVIAISVFIWLKLTGWYVYKYFALFEVFNYISACYILLMVHINNVIKNRFEKIDDFLQQSASHEMRYVYYITNSAIIQASRMANLKIKLNMLRKSYKTLVNVINHYNTLFGYQILFQLAHLLASLLERLCGTTNISPKGDTSSLAYIFRSWILAQGIVSVGFNVVSTTLKIVINSISSVLITQ